MVLAEMTSGVLFQNRWTGAGFYIDISSSILALVD